MFIEDTSETISDAFVLLVSGDRLASILDLEKKLDSLDWGDCGFGDCG